MRLFKVMFIGLVSASLFVAGCSSSSEETSSTSSTSAATAGGSTSASDYDSVSAYTATNTPSSTKVAVPDTLSSSSTTTARSLSRVAQMSRSMAKSASQKGTGDSKALEMSQQVVASMKRTTSEVDRTMIYLDAAIAGGTVKLATDATTGCQEPGEVKFIMTAEMAKAIIERSTQDFGGSENDADNAAMVAEIKGMIGQEMSGPAIHYYSATVMGVAGKVLAIGQDNRDETGSGSVSACDNGKLDKPQELIKWSDDYTKLDYKATFSDSNGEAIKITMTYDDTNKISATELKGKDKDGSRFTFGGKFRECKATEAKNCVDFKIFVKFKDTQGEGQIKIKGRADNDGGFAKGKVAFQDAGSSQSFNAWMKEYFDGDGVLTGLKFADDAGNDCFKSDSSCTWHTVMGSDAADSYEGGAEDTSAGGKEMTFAYSPTFPSSTADDGEYIIFVAGETPSEQSAVGFVGVQGGEIVDVELFMQPEKSGDTGDIYKVESYDATSGEPTFASAKTTTVTVTF